MINWQAIGEQTFNVLDPVCGFWTETGFTRNQHEAKNYTQADLSNEQLQCIDKTNCTLMSA